MSAAPMCEMTEPSEYSTMECTALWRCTMGWIIENGASKRWCASIASRPLFMSVEESVVTLAPIDQLGWLSACLAST